MASFIEELSPDMRVACVLVRRWKSYTQRCVVNASFDEIDENEIYRYVVR